MSSVLEFFFNIVLIILLGLTVGYCWRLNKRIGILQDSRSELANLLKHFDESTTRASESIVALQQVSKKIGETIQARIDKAHYAMDDLNFLIERAGKIADTLEAGLVSARQRERSSAQFAKPPVRMEEDYDTPPRIIQKEDSNIKPKTAAPLHSDRAEEHHDVLEAEKNSTSGAMATLQAMLEKLSARNKPAEKSAPARTANTASKRPRSQAEKELMELIRSGNKS